MMDLHVGNCVTCLKKKFSLLAGLSNKELALLDKERVLIRYRKGETILKAGTKPHGLLCLSEGKAKIIRELTDNKELIIHLAKPMEFIGFPTLLCDDLSATTIIALEDSAVCIIKKDHLFHVIQSNPDFANLLIRYLSREVISSDNRLVNLTQKYIKERLADTLLMLHEAYGDKEGNIGISLSREEIASIANMTRSNAIRTLYEFEKSGLVKIKGRRIKIVDGNGLADISKN